MNDEYFVKQRAIIACVERLGIANNLGHAADLEPLWNAARDFYAPKPDTDGGDALIEAANNSIAITGAAFNISAMLNTYRGSKLGSFIIDKIRVEIDKILAANKTTFANQTADKEQVK